MPWFVLDVALAVLALLALVLVALMLYRRVRGLMRTVGTAAERIGEASAALEAPPARTLGSSPIEETP